VITVPWGERLGGAENLLWTFLRNVDQRRLLPTVVFLQPGSFVREVEGLGLQAVVVNAGRLRDAPMFLRTVREIASLLRMNRPHILLNWSAKTQVYGALAALSVGMGDRVVWWQHGIPRTDALDGVARLLPAQAVGCCSHFILRAQQRRWPRRRAVMVYPGIDAPRPLRDDQLRELRSSLAIPLGSLVVGIVGRLQPWKGQDRLLRAIAAVSRRSHDIYGLIVGGNAYGLSPAYEAELHRLARELGIEDRVIFTGQVPEAAPYTQLMDVSVNASHIESFGLVLLEAMALSVPVVAFNAGGPAEIIESERSGILVPMEGTPSLADAIERLVSDGELRRRIGEFGYERYQALFSSQRMTLELEDLLAAIPSAKRNPFPAATGSVGTD
jgi:glycosyltransferase involved in cell wall biosynthesis